MEIFTAILAFLTTGENVLSLGWIVALVEGFMIAKLIREENAVIKDLRASLDENMDARITDIKEITTRYEQQSKAITNALQKLSRKSGNSNE